MLYWLRLPSPDVGRRLMEVDLCPGVPGSSLGNGELGCSSLALLFIVSNLLVAFCLVANVWYFRRAEPLLNDNEHWLRGYLLCSLTAICLAAMLSPHSLQAWHTTVILQAACIPVASWVAALRPRLAWRSWFGSMLALFLVTRLAVVIVLAIGHPMFVTPDDPHILREMLPCELRRLLP